MAKASRSNGTISANHRDWSALPDAALFAISAKLVPSVVDLFAFGDVCRPWRSVWALSWPHLVASLPPFVMPSCIRPRQPIVFHIPTDGRRIRRRHDAARKHCCNGFFHGHLIMYDTSGRCPLHLRKPMTGARIALPPPRTGDLIGYRYSILTAPPCSPNSILLVFRDNGIQFCYPSGGSGDWVDRKLVLADGSIVPTASILDAVAVSEDVVYFITDSGYLYSLEFYPCLRVCSLVRFAPGSYFSSSDEVYLVEAGGEVMAVVVLIFPGRMLEMIVYRLDSARPAWVKVGSLGDRAFFLSTTGYSVTVDGWGGRKNCIYYVRSEREWGVYDMETRVFEIFPSCDSDSQQQSSVGGRPIWIVPSLCC